MKCIKKLGCIALSAAFLLGAGACSQFSIPSSSAMRSTATASARYGIPESEMSIHFSRTKIFGSMQELVDDTPLIVTGIISNTRVTHDVDGISHVTLHDVAISSVIKGDAVQPGETLVLRQTGKDDPSILRNGEMALLFLLPSGLPDDLADQYFPKGVYAGIYMLHDTAKAAALQSVEDGESVPTSIDGIDFSRLIVDTADDLPDTVSIGDVRRAVDSSVN